MRNRVGACDILHSDFEAPVGILKSHDPAVHWDEKTHQYDDSGKRDLGDLASVVIVQAIEISTELKPRHRPKRGHDGDGGQHHGGNNESGYRQALHQELDQKKKRSEVVRHDFPPRKRSNLKYRRVYADDPEIPKGKLCRIVSKSGKPAKRFAQCFLTGNNLVIAPRFLRELANNDRRKDASGKEIQAPCNLDPADPNALEQGDVQRDQKDIGHRKLAQNLQNRKHFSAQQAKVNESEADGFQVRRKERKYGHEQGEK